MTSKTIVPGLLVFVLVALLVYFAFAMMDEGSPDPEFATNETPTELVQTTLPMETEQVPTAIETESFRREVAKPKVVEPEQEVPKGPFNLLEVSFQFDQPQFLSGLDIRYRSPQFGERLTYLDSSAQTVLVSNRVPDSTETIEVLPNIDEFQTLLFYTLPPPEKGVWQVTVQPERILVNAKALKRALTKRRAEKVRFQVSVAAVPEGHLRNSRIELIGTSGVEKSLDYVVLNEKNQALGRGSIRLRGHSSHFIALGSVLTQGEPKTLELTDRSGKRVGRTAIDARADMAYLAYYASCSWQDCVEVTGKVTTIANLPFRGSAWIAFELTPWEGSHRPAVYRLARYTPEDHPLYQGAHVPQQYQAGTFAVLVAPGSKVTLRAMLQDPLVTGQTQGKPVTVETPSYGSIDAGSLSLR